MNFGAFIRLLGYLTGVKSARNRDDGGIRSLEAVFFHFLCIVDQKRLETRKTREIADRRGREVFVGDESVCDR